MPIIRIATRGSQLALWQARWVQHQLSARYPGIRTELVIIKTRGDKILDVPLAKVGGKGLFVKEIEDALLADEADLAVHSMKDVPAELPAGLTLGIIPQREIATDTLLSMRYPSLNDLPQGARVGTSSLRRHTQLLALRPDLTIVSLRGNLDTRVRKLHDGAFDAIVVASAGLKRLGLSAPYAEELAPPRFFPAVAQGALGIEYRDDRADLHELLSFLDHPASRWCVTAERAFLFGLDGGCQVPIAGHAVLDDTGRHLQLTGLVADLAGTTIIQHKATAKVKDAAALGAQVAQMVLHGGGREILAAVYGEDVRT